jgi:hypothetical protein
MPRIALLSLLLLALVIAPAVAQTESTSSAENPLWEVHLNVQQLFASPLGEVINEIINEKAPDGKLNVDALVQAIGIDPRTEVTHVVVYGDDFEKPNLTAIADIGKSRGNIEGWLLAAPGYESESLDDNTILHSFVHEDEHPRIWCAIPKAGDSYVFVAGFSDDKVRSLVQEVSKGGVSDRLTGNTFLSLNVNDLSQAPFEIDENDPGSGIIKTLKTISLTAANEENELLVTSELTTDSAARAQQLNQLIVGMKAMVQLALPEKHPQASQHAKMLNNLNVEYTEGSTTLSTRFAMPYDELKELVSEMHHHKK